jgi:hypothetical protein
MKTILGTIHIFQIINKFSRISRTVSKPNLPTITDKQLDVYSQHHTQPVLLPINLTLSCYAPILPQPSSIALSVKQLYAYLRQMTM